MKINIYVNKNGNILKKFFFYDIILLFQAFGTV